MSIQTDVETLGDSSADWGNGPAPEKHRIAPDVAFLKFLAEKARPGNQYQDALDTIFKFAAKNLGIPVPDEDVPQTTARFVYSGPAAAPDNVFYHHDS